MRSTVHPAAARRDVLNFGDKNSSDLDKFDINQKHFSNAKTGEKMGRKGQAGGENRACKSAAAPVPTHGVTAELTPPSGIDSNDQGLILDSVGADPNINIATVGGPTNRADDGCNIECCNINIATVGTPTNRADEGCNINIATVGKNECCNIATLEKTQPGNFSKKSSKIVIIDFYEEKFENLKETLGIIYSFSDIRPLSLKKLEKGGISILLRNSSNKVTVEKLLHDKLKGRIKPLSFVDSKTLFEICCVIPKECEAQDICEKIGAEKFITRLNGITVFFMKSKTEAQKLLKEGYFADPYLLLFDVFVFSPHICCRNCGSLKHKSCEAKLCDHCGLSLPHDTTSCSPKCLFCSGPHPFSKCASYKEKVTKAKESKKSTYAEALRNGNSFTRTPAIADSRADVVNVPPRILTAADVPYTVKADIVTKSLKIYTEKTGNVSLYTTEFLLSTMNELEKRIYKDNAESLGTQQKIIKTGSEKKEMIAPSTQIKNTKKKVSFAEPLASSQVQTKGKSKARYEDSIKAIESNMDLEHECLPETDEDLNEEDIVILQSKKKKAALDRSKIDVRVTAKAYCACGVEFRANPGWKNHLTRASKCHLNPSVTCGCGLIVLTERNWNQTYSRLVQHLRSGSCSIAEQ
jgi:hypothetical protein